MPSLWLEQLTNNEQPLITLSFSFLTSLFFGKKNFFVKERKEQKERTTYCSTNVDYESPTQKKLTRHTMNAQSKNLSPQVYPHCHHQSQEDDQKKNQCTKNIDRSIHPCWHRLAISDQLPYQERDPIQAVLRHRDELPSCTLHHSPTVSHGTHRFQDFSEAQTVQLSTWTTSSWKHEMPVHVTQLSNSDHQKDRG